MIGVIIFSKMESWTIIIKNYYYQKLSLKPFDDHFEQYVTYRIFLQSFLCLLFYLLESLYSLFIFQGVGVQAWKFRKHDFEIVVGSKVPPSGPNVWPGLETLDQCGPAWRPRPFSHQKRPTKTNMKNKHHNLNLSSPIDR